MPEKSRVVKLKISSTRLAAILPPPDSTPIKSEKPKKKSKKAAAEPKEAAREVQTPVKPAKESKKASKKKGTPAVEPIQTPAPPITVSTPKTAGSGIKIKFNVNSLKNAVKETDGAVPQTPGTARAVATMSSQALTPAVIAAPPTGSRPPQLSNLPPLQTKIPATPSADTTAATPSVPKIRLKTSFSAIKSAAGIGAETPKTPIIKLKSAASRPTTTRRAVPIGYGYDSEASDREDDPAIEEQFILRMPPGEDCDFLRSEIEKKEFGKSTDVWFKFIDDRRAVVSIRKKLYSATLVDLPCIIESSKTIDKGRNVFKTADISQMLLVGDPLVFEEQVQSNVLRNSLVNYPHGITPPMHWARRRRFRKRAVNRNMDQVEEMVDKLLAADADAEMVEYEMVTEGQLAEEEEAKKRNDPATRVLYDGEEDADGEVDMAYDDEEEEYEYEDGDRMEGDEGMDLMDFEGELAEAMMDHTEHNHSEIQKKGNDGATSDEDDDDEDEDEEDGDAMDLDPGTSAEKRQLKEEIADLERAVRHKMSEKDTVQNQIVRQRIQNVIDGLNAELELKRSSLEGMA